MNFLQSNRYAFLLTLLLSSASIAASAGEPAETTGTTTNTTVITPENMTRADGEMLNEHTARYNQCLRETSVQQMQRVDDPRHVVDHAMKTCAVKLEELDTKMQARNFDPNFRNGYLRSVSNRSANKTLRLIMSGMANRQDPAAAQ